MAFQDVMHTSNPSYEYAFSWTIDNFSKNLLKFQGPTFTPIPGYAGKFRFELAVGEVTELRCPPEYPSWCDACNTDNCDCTDMVPALDLKLICLNNNDPRLHVVADIMLGNEHVSIFNMKTRLIKVEQTTTLCCHSQSHFDWPLDNCEMKMEGTLEFSGYKVTSYVYPPSFQLPSENYREVSKDLQTMYESGLGSDITFSVGEEKFRAHKAILSCRSPVFMKMFEHDMLENNTNNVNIEDIDPHSFNCFLMFLYTGNVQNHAFETVKSLYWVGEKYQVKGLQKACVGLLANQLSIESVCNVLVLADLHADEGLKQFVKIFIRENFYDIVDTTSWAELVNSKPELVNDVMSSIKSANNNNN